MPLTRRPSGAPVPVGVAPTSRRRNARRQVVDDLPAVDVAGEFADLDEGRRRRLVDDPARHLHAARRAIDAHRGVLDQRHVADGGLVHESEMREIEQVVADELPVALRVQIVGLGAPVRIVEPMVVGDLGGIGQRRIAHPDPQPLVALDHRIGLHPRARRDHVLARHAHAGAGAIEAQPVIVALQHVAARRACPSTAAGGGAGSDPPARSACRPRCGRTPPARS